MGMRMRCDGTARMPAAMSAGMVVALLNISTNAFAESFVAGTTPDRRPNGAPTISKIEKSDAWRAKAVTGVSQPYPASLKFLDDQGGWFNPFMHAGMTGPYDIRGWHAAATANSSQSK